MTASRSLLALLLACFVCLGPGVFADDASGAEESIDTLEQRYEKLLEYSDFASFSKRMAAVRDMGKLGTPRARATLMKIVHRAKVIDDKVVAIISLGARLDVKTAKLLADLVGRKREAMLVQALGEAFASASDEATLTWIATDALNTKKKGVLLAALDAQFVHADPRARARIEEIYAEHKEKSSGVDIAHAAVRAMGSIGGPEVRRFILRTPAHPDWRVRLAAADVMARQKPIDINIRGALRKLLVDDEPVVRQRTAFTIGEARLDELVPYVAERLDDPHIKTRAVAHAALRKITHKELGFDKQDWINWFKNRPVDTEKLKPSPSNSVSAYYGVKIHSDRLLFIVDLSGSMAFPFGQKNTRIEVARGQLRKALERLNPETLFNVLVFSDRVKAWRKGETLATKDAIGKALKWVDKTFEEPRGGTYMHAALAKAFAENPQMDTIFLLTDGLATDGEPIVPEAILASVNRWNRYRRVVIHTFALTLEELDPTGLHEKSLANIKRFMKQLARATGGECKIVAKPPK